MIDIVCVVCRLVMSDSLQPQDCSPPGSSVHGILQARILEWVACPPPGDLLNPETEPTSFMSPAFAGGFFTTRANRKPGSSGWIFSSVKPGVAHVAEASVVEAARVISHRRCVWCSSTLWVLPLCCQFIHSQCSFPWWFVSNIIAEETKVTNNPWNVILI